MGFLRTCCCGCTLRTGTIIIGSLSLTFATIYLCLTIVAIAFVEQASDEINREMSRKSDFNTDFSSDIGNSPSFNLESKSSIADLKITTNDLLSENDINGGDNDSSLMFDLKSFTIELLAIIVVGASISVITSILLIIGAAKGHMWLLLPWIANVSLGIIGYICSSIYNLVKLSQKTSGGLVFLSVLIMFGVLALDFYLLMVVISHFEELKKNKRCGDGSNIGQIYSSPSPWSSTTQIISTIPEKEGA